MGFVLGSSLEEAFEEGVDIEGFLAGVSAMSQKGMQITYDEDSLAMVRSTELEECLEDARCLLISKEWIGVGWEEDMYSRCKVDGVGLDQPRDTAGK